MSAQMPVPRPAGQRKEQPQNSVAPKRPPPPPPPPPKKRKEGNASK